MITKTDLDYIEAKTRELVEKVLKTRVSYISIGIFAKEYLETNCSITHIRGKDCEDHDRFGSESMQTSIYMPVKEG